MSKGRHVPDPTTDPRDAALARKLLLRLAATEGEHDQVCAWHLRALGVDETTIASARRLWDAAGELLREEESE